MLARSEGWAQSLFDAYKVTPKLVRKDSVSRTAWLRATQGAIGTAVMARKTGNSRDLCGFCHPARKAKGRETSREVGLSRAITPAINPHETGVSQPCALLRRSALRAKSTRAVAVYMAP